MLFANIVLSGRVQGVGFRYFVVENAERLNVAGEVWNNYDGTVELKAYVDDRNTLDSFIADLKQGPPLSNVVDMKIDVTASDPPVEPGFSIKQ